MGGRLEPNPLPACEHCGETRQIEVLTNLRTRWGCYCNVCGRTFAVRKPVVVQLLEREGLIRGTDD